MKNFLKILVGNFMWVYYQIRYRLNVRFSGREDSGIKRSFISNRNEVSHILREKIESGQPFLAGRMGMSEAYTMRTFEFNHKSHYSIALKQLHEWSGFFPEEISSGRRFLEVYKDAMQELDMCGILKCPAGEYFINHFTKKDCKITVLFNYECFWDDAPWSSLLEGKKVLVIHPFAQTIEQQYKKRKLLFPGKEILPQMDLIIYKSVQTAAGEVDGRFQTWFEALQFMTEEIGKIEFDIALLGCGAYGLPLAANIKRMGKQAIHIGGGLQLFFGIRGKRWDEQPKIAALYNDEWVYPNGDETPSNSKIIENSCYWK